MRSTSFAITDAGSASFLAFFARKFYPLASSGLTETFPNLKSRGKTPVPSVRKLVGKFAHLVGLISTERQKCY